MFYCTFREYRPVTAREREKDRQTDRQTRRTGRWQNTVRRAISICWTLSWCAECQYGAIGIGQL